jgi:tetratricopeptide (TPR) repeat protein
MAEHLPDHPWRYQLATSIPLGRRDFDAVDSYLATLTEAQFAGAAGYSCIVDLQRARFRDWRACSASDPWLRDDVLLVLAEFRMTGDTVRARRQYEAIRAATGEARNTDEFGPVIALLAELGRVNEARAVLQEWRASAQPNDPGLRSDSSFALGSIAAAERRWQEAADAFLAWNRALQPSAFHIYNRGLAEAANALERIGQPDSSIALLERAMETPSIAGGALYEATWYAQGLQQLGELYEAKGERAKAAEYYQKYLTLLRDAEAPMDAQVRAVREKYERVTSEPRRQG